ncbi:hypothetical protein VNO80_16676 [Phaseolus coccineus]|uniref:Uncharacterized protein n=1 Tax=Phaseolus coccineus TaxID=3886 RepID=A0AAN9MMU8_PHACN
MKTRADLCQIFGVLEKSRCGKFMFYLFNFFFNLLSKNHGKGQKKHFTVHIHMLLNLKISVSSYMWHVCVPPAAPLTIKRLSHKSSHH